MAKSKKQEDKPESEEPIMERTKEALRRALNTPHEAHKEMVERRRGNTKPSGRSKKALRRGQYTESANMAAISMMTIEETNIQTPKKSTRGQLY
jgi:hypothetical protein